MAWATARMQRLDPTRIHLPRADARAIDAAAREGMTRADLEAIGAWLETPRAGWWQDRGYHVAGWAAVLGRDGGRWRERAAEARPPRAAAPEPTWRPPTAAPVAPRGACPDCGVPGCDWSAADLADAIGLSDGVALDVLVGIADLAGCRLTLARAAVAPARLTLVAGASA